MSHQQFVYEGIRVIVKDGRKYYVTDDVTDYVGYVMRMAQRISQEVGGRHKVLLYNRFSAGHQPRRFLANVISYEDLVSVVSHHSRLYGVLDVIDTIEKMESPAIEQYVKEFESNLRKYSVAYCEMKKSKRQKTLSCPLMQS